MTPRVLFSCVRGTTNHVRSKTEVAYNPTHNEKVFVKDGTITSIKEACGAGVKNVWGKGAFDKETGKLRSNATDAAGSGIVLSWKPKDADDAAVVEILLRTANVKPIFMMEVAMVENEAVLKPYGCLFHLQKSLDVVHGDNELPLAPC